MRLLRLSLSPVVLLLIALGPGPAATADDTDPGILRQLEQRLSDDQMQDVRFLEHVGWRFVRDPAVDAIHFDAGFPCRHDDLAAAQRAGALRIRFPTNPTAAQFEAFGRRAPLVADSIPTRCAYKHKIVVATRRAVARIGKLTEAGRYKFPDILLGAFDSPWWKVSLPQPEWELRDRVWYAKDSASAAMQSLYRRGGIAECYAGQAIMVYAIQYELYGPAAFDAVFRGDDLSVGRPPDIKSTPIGGFTRWDVRWPYRALVIPAAEQQKDVVYPLGRQGRMAFVGLSGIVRNQVEDTRSNENWICTSISYAALQELLQGGGLKFVARLMTEVWAAAKPGRGLFASATAKRTAAEKVHAVLSRPIFSEWMFYVHPYGNVSLADITRKKLDKVDTPLMVVFYNHGREDGLFKRYRDAFKRGLLNRGTAAVPAGLRRGR